MTGAYEHIAETVAAHGLALRGGFVVRDDDGVPDVADGRPAATVLMIGNVGRAMWPHFSAARTEGAHPLDRWVRQVVEPIAATHGARAVYPFDAPPLPFQRWARRAWPLHASPLGLLIDAEFGLWHALRAALLFERALDLPTAPPRPSPCATCAEKPCLTTCPVNAYTTAGFDYVSCRAHLATPAGAACMTSGCRARDACPVGSAHRYDEAQVRFHQRAFSAADAPKR